MHTHYFRLKGSESSLAIKLKPDVMIKNQRTALNMKFGFSGISGPVYSSAHKEAAIMIAGTISLSMVLCFPVIPRPNTGDV